MTREIHYPALILSVLTGAVATFVAMAALLGPAGVSRLEGCGGGGSEIGGGPTTSQLAQRCR